MNARLPHPTVPTPNGNRLFRPTRSCRRVIALLALGAGLLLPAAHAANITLTEAMLDDYHINGIIDFSQTTIGYGANAVPNNLQPGDTIYIQGHTRQLLRLKNLTQGTAANPITITNTGGQFIIDQEVIGGVLKTGQGIGLWGCQHAILQGTPSPGNYDYGIKIASSTAGGGTVKVGHNGQTGAAFIGSLDVEITGLEIANTGFAGIQAKCEIAAADLPAGGYVMDNLRIHHNYIHDTGGEAMYIGWVYDGHHELSNVSIHDNLIVNPGWDGIQLNHSQGTNSIFNNTILNYGVTSYTAADIGQPYGWQNEGFSVGRCTNLSIWNNWVQAGNAYSGSAVNFSIHGTGNVFNNVFVLGAFGATTHEDAIYVNQSAAPLAGAVLNVMNNTIVEPDNNGLGFNGAVTKPVNFFNNIVAHPINGTYTASHAALTTATNLHVSTVAAAGFVDAANDDYHLAGGSAALDAGTDVTAYGITDDYDGLSRPQGSAYDIGAYEREAAITLGIITPVAWGTATGSAYCAATGAFNAQPVWDAANLRPTGNDPVPNSDTTTYYANRHWYLDLGADWSKVRITGMWTRYRPYSGGSYGGFASMWWDDDKDNVNDGTTAPTMNFANAQGLSHINAQQWAQDRDFTAAPIVPQGRYLVISTGATPTNRCNEFALIGYVVP